MVSGSQSDFYYTNYLLPQALRSPVTITVRQQQEQEQMRRLNKVNSQHTNLYQELGRRKEIKLKFSRSELSWRSKYHHHITTNEMKTVGNASQELDRCIWLTAKSIQSSIFQEISFLVHQPFTACSLETQIKTNDNPPPSVMASHSLHLECCMLYY